MDSSTNQTQIRQNPATYQAAAVLTGLALFGVVYDRAVEWCLNQPWGESKSSLAVVIGVAVTISAMTPIIGRRAALWLLAGFTASGTPMITGQLQRHARRYARALRRAARNDYEL